MIFSGGVKVLILDDIIFDKKTENFSIKRSSFTDASFIAASVYFDINKVF